MQWTTAGEENPGDAEAKGKRYATCQPRIWCTRTCDNTQYEVHAQAVPPRPSTLHARKTTRATQTQDMIEQEHQEDDARGEPATPSTRTTGAWPTPMTSAAPEAGNTHQARSPQAPPRWYTARTRSQPPSGAWAITPALPTEPGPKGGRRRGRERHDDNWNRDPTKPITTYRLQRPQHTPNRKQHDTPVYPRPAPHRV